MDKLMMEIEEFFSKAVAETYDRLVRGEGVLPNNVQAEQEGRLAQPDAQAGLSTPLSEYPPGSSYTPAT